MGKATILSGGAGGLYNVTLDYGQQKKLDEIAAIDKRITDITVNLVSVNAALASEDAAVAAAQVTLDNAITAYELAVQTNPNQDLTPFQTAITAAINGVAAANQKRQPVANGKGFLDAEKNNLQARKDYLLSLKLQINTQAWCADLTEDGTGQVGTIEVPGEPKKTLIVPGALAPTAADGQVVAREVQRFDQAFFNAALLPGWQKFKPTYRTGEIFNINGDVCSVDLDYEESTPRELPINQADILNNVPIEYLSCNGAAFEEGDKVVVKFQDQNWNSPKVIGFVSNPKSCAPIVIFKIKLVVQESKGNVGSGFGDGFQAYEGIVGTLTDNVALPALPDISQIPWLTKNIFISIDQPVYVSNKKSQVLNFSNIQAIKNSDLDTDFISGVKVAVCATGIINEFGNSIYTLNETPPITITKLNVDATRNIVNFSPLTYDYQFNLIPPIFNYTTKYPFQSNGFLIQENNQSTDNNLILSVNGALANTLDAYGQVFGVASNNPSYSGGYFWSLNGQQYNMVLDQGAYTTSWVDWNNGVRTDTFPNYINNELSVSTLPTYNGYTPKNIIKVWQAASWSSMDVTIPLDDVSQRELVVQDSFYFAVEYE